MLGGRSVGKILTSSEERPNWAFGRLSQFPLVILLLFLFVQEVLLALQTSYI